MSNPELFKLCEEEQDLVRELYAVIAEEIVQNDGIISFSRYMELALYYPRLGYYCNPLFKFGVKGDFVTAPLLSNLFGHLIARQITELFSFGIKPQILEFGAGNGKLAVDILASLGDSLEHYYILELSADLIMVQRETIAAKSPQYIAKVEWLTSLPTDFCGVMLANEVLDAQPCNLVHYHDGVLFAVGVTLDEDEELSYQDYPGDSETLAIASDLNLPIDNYLTEINLASRAFMHSLSHSLSHGAILLIDYGYGEREYYHPQKNRGTLRGFYRQHVLDDVLTYPGLIDITASVDWTSITTAAISSGLELIGYTTQANFLLNCGLSDLMTKLKQKLNDKEYLHLSNQINKLISHTEMGDLFKVCGFSKGLAQDEWLGFSHGDRSYSL